MMRAMKQLGMTAAIIGAMSAAPVLAQEIPADASNFYKSESVTVRQVTFPNQYNMNIAGNLFLPKNLDQKTKHAAIIVGHPMGAVKEQSANLYAVKMAEQGFVTLSVDLAFWGGSEGQPRNAVSPDLYAETFSAAADFLGTNPLVDRERIGVIGICGSGSFAISAAKIDPRLKAIATISMYDMGAANRNGLRHGMTLEQRKQILREAAEQRYAEFTGGETRYTSGTVHELTETSTPIEREFYAFYRTPRGEFTPEGSSPQLTTPDVHQRRQVHELLPVLGHQTFPRPMLFTWAKGALHRVQRRRVQARGGTEGTVSSPEPGMWICMTGQALSPSASSPTSLRKT
ncbi:MAG: alpha/beta hydrolase [Bilophila wadsworthia]